MFRDSNSFWENTPRKYFDREELNSKWNTIIDDSLIVRSRIKSAVKFSDCDWSSPVKENIMKDVINNSYITRVNEKTYNQFGSHEAKYSNNFVTDSDPSNSQPFSKSLKKRVFDQKISEFAKSSPGRKKSVQSYHKIEKQIVDEYTIKNSKNKSHTNSKGNLIICHTPSDQLNPTYNSSNSAIITAYERKNNNAIKAIRARGQPTPAPPAGDK